MIRSVLTAVGAFVLSCAALAQDFPLRPIRIVIPFAPGGVSDLIVRAISEPLAKALGQAIVQDNRGGAGGTLAAEQVARAAADGHTLMLGNGGNLTVAPSLYKNLPYDPQRDFLPVSMVARSQLVLVVHPALPTASVRELVQLAKAKPGQIKYASSGIGAGPHLAAELLKSFTSIDIVHVPYKGSAPMLADLMSGQVEMAFDALATSLPHIRSGRLKALAVGSGSRSPFAPEVPTIAESGFPQFKYSSFFALVAPAKTPAHIMEILSREVVNIANSEGVRSRLLAFGLEPAPLAAGELDAMLRKERALWSAVVASARIVPE